MKRDGRSRRRHEERFDYLTRPIDEAFNRFKTIFNADPFKYTVEEKVRAVEDVERYTLSKLIQRDDDGRPTKFTDMVLKIREIEEELEATKSLSKKFLYLFAPQHEILRKFGGHVDVDYRAFIVIGRMGSGKTEFVKRKVAEAIENVLFPKGFEEPDILFLHFIRYPNHDLIRKTIEILSREVDVDRLSYLYIFNDDPLATTGAYARESMTKHNILSGKELFYIRHHLHNETNFRGYIILLNAEQRLGALDKNIRDTTSSWLFKSPPMDITAASVLKYLEKQYGAKFVDALIELGMKLDNIPPYRSPKYHRDALSTAIGIIYNAPFRMYCYDYKIPREIYRVITYHEYPEDAYQLFMKLLSRYGPDNASEILRQFLD